MKHSYSSCLYLFAASTMLFATSIVAQPNKQPAHKIMPAKVPVPTQAQIQKVFPNASWDLFKNGRQVTVFWVERGASSPEASDFHGCHIRGEHNVTTIGLQARLKSGIEEAIANDPGYGAKCFIPVHGLRVSDGTQSVDLLICFGCRRLVVFSGAAKSYSTIGGSGDTETLLNCVLRGSIQ